MRNLLKWLLHSIRNEGLSAVTFRVVHSFNCWSGLLILRFPQKRRLLKPDAYSEWRQAQVSVFFDFQILPSFPKPSPVLIEKIANYRQGKFLYFQKSWYSTVGWHTHPITGVEFDKELHWSKIRDITAQGDIKYIWEKSRFTFIYDFIRYQQFSGELIAGEVFALMENWIKENPVNTGPNWICSQEISIRVVNWIFALYYFRTSSELSDQRLQLILQSIHDQMTHVWKNRHFARQLVRNNHILTESLALYMTGILLPFLPDSIKWIETGKITFDNEIDRQIFNDGTYLQFSMNYHRMVIQLISWYWQLSKINNQVVAEHVKEKAVKSILFLRQCMNCHTGELPNYGHNDGTLLFPLTDCDYNDFRPTLVALAAIAGMPEMIECGPWDEETVWITGKLPERKNDPGPCMIGNLSSFPDSGYYIIRDQRTITFVRCGAYQHRPAQADNLHVDLWVDGENIMQDSGSYSYNTDAQVLRYYMGTAAHNSLMLNGYDQMEKGPRFLWYNWIKNASGICFQENEYAVFEGKFEGFRQIGTGINHARRVVKQVDRIEWKITDQISNAPVNSCFQLIWHPMSGFFDKFSLEVFSIDGELLKPAFEVTGFSRYYGYQELKTSLKYSSQSPGFISIIREKEKCV